MASASTISPSLELFYSYAHADATLFEALKKHLAALRRAQLISDWYDGDILPGAEWKAEIQAAMERAGIILLLISADFLDSEYCYNIELPFALKRHQAGSAIVVPVLLRPVEWKDTPFAILQALPDAARAVTLWPNQDEAFAEVAARLRELIYAQRLASTKPAPVVQSSTVAQQRVLDAAVASRIPLGEPADVVTMVRTEDSNGLKAILQLDTTYSIPPENVQSKSFEVEFPRDPSGQVLPAALELVLDSPGCDPPQQRRKLRVPPSGDSDVCVFLLTPLKTGRLMLNLEVRYEDVEVGSRLLVTEAGPSTAAPAPYSLVSVPLTSTAAWGMSLPGVQKAYAPLPSPPAPQSAAAPGPSPASSPPRAGEGPPRKLHRVRPPAGVAWEFGDGSSDSARSEGGVKASGTVVSISSAAAPQRKSWLSRPLMATMASAAAIVVIGGVLLTTGPIGQAPVDVATGPPATIPAPPPPPATSAAPSPGPSSGAAGGSTHPVEAVTALRPSPQATPAARAALDAGLAASERGDYLVAVGSFTRAIKQDPTNAQLYWLRAEAFQHLKEPSLALRDLDQSIRLAPDAAYPHLLKGEVLSASGLHPEALQEYQHAATSPSASPQAKEFAAKHVQQSAVKQAQ